MKPVDQLAEFRQGNYDAVIRHEWGISQHSIYKPCPPLHIVQPGGDGPALWCTGSAAHVGVVHPLQKYCRECLRLAKEEAEEYGDK